MNENKNCLKKLLTFYEYNSEIQQLTHTHPRAGEYILTESLFHIPSADELKRRTVLIRC